MVKVLSEHFITGACHAPVNIRQGKVCKVQTRGYRLPDYLSVNYRLRKGALNQGVHTAG